MSNALDLRRNIADLFESSNLPRTLENDIFNWVKSKYSQDVISLHVAKCCQVLNQIKKNPNLKNNPNLINTHYKNLSPEKWALFEQDLKMLDSKIKDFDHPIYASDTFKCYNCGKRKCVFSPVQIKSCDESTTIFVRCINCHHCFHIS